MALPLQHGIVASGVMTSHQHCTGKKHLKDLETFVNLSEGKLANFGRLRPLRVACTKGIWVVVKVMVPFCVLSIIRHLVYRGPKRGP